MDTAATVLNMKATFQCLYANFPSCVNTIYLCLFSTCIPLPVWTHQFSIVVTNSCTLPCPLTSKNSVLTISYSMVRYTFIHPIRPHECAKHCVHLTTLYHLPLDLGLGSKPPDVREEQKRSALDVKHTHMSPNTTKCLWEGRAGRYFLILNAFAPFQI